MGELMLVGYQINAIQAYLVLVILDNTTSLGYSYSDDDHHSKIMTTINH